MSPPYSEYMCKIYFQNAYGDFDLGKTYGGLPPEGPTKNPRKGSCTGSYALPVPPEWLRSQKYELIRKRAGSKQHIMDTNNFNKSRSGSTEMLPGWLGSVLSGTLGTSVAPVVVADDPALSYKDEKRTANTMGKYKNLLQNGDSLPEVTMKNCYRVDYIRGS